MIEALWRGPRKILEDRQTERLRTLLREVIPANPFWTNRFREAGVDPARIETPADLDRLPPVTKADLVADQQQHPPYGSNLTYPRQQYIRLHQTSGTTGAPLRWMDTRASWEWCLECWGQIFQLVGLRADDRLCFPFSFGPFLGFWAAFEGAQRRGQFCLAAGGLSTTARLQLIREHQATFLCCTPTYALRLAEAARAEGASLEHGPVRGLIVAGEPGGNLPAARAQIAEGFGARVFDHWGMTELGPLATEVEADPGHLALLETESITEILDLQTEQTVAPGNPGELVMTNLGRTACPLIRYRTGDLVEEHPDPSPAGFNLRRLRGGIKGRCDDMLTVRGNNLYPAALEDVIRQVTGVAEYRIEVRTLRGMHELRVEVEPTEEFASADRVRSLIQRTANAVKDRFHFQVEVAAVPVRHLPRFEMKGQRFHHTREG